MPVISKFMHASAASRFVRLCFVAIFATMSLMHGPVMAYSGEHHAPAAGHHHGHDGGHEGHGHSDRPAGPASCNGFACFIAVEPMLVSARPLHVVLIGILRFDPASELHATSAQPNVPPPRLPS